MKGHTNDRKQKMILHKEISKFAASVGSQER